MLYICITSSTLHNDLAEKIGFSLFYRGKCDSEGPRGWEMVEPTSAFVSLTLKVKAFPTAPQWPCFSCFVCRTARAGLERCPDFPLVGKASGPDARPQEPGTQQEVQIPPRPNGLQVPVSEHLVRRHHRGPHHHHWHLHQPHLLGTLQQVSNSLGRRIPTKHPPCARNMARC